MDRRLIEAANTGDVEKLQNLIKENPLLLRTLNLATNGDNPLHVACIGGHVNIVKEVLNLRPEFANGLNGDGLSPLHIASANGDAEIVKELLKVGSHLCLVKGREKRVPLHYAVARGRIDVITELLSACLESITKVSARGETCFHLALKHNQFKAFKVLCKNVVRLEKEDVLKNKDEQGNTILHIAASKKQYEVVDFLLNKNAGFKGVLEVNVVNKKGFTPLDVLLLEGGDCEIEEMLTLAAGVTTGSVSSSHNQTQLQEPQPLRPKSTYQKLQDLFKYDRIKECPSEARSTLLVMAVLIATVTYSAVLSPPGGLWQDDSWVNPAPQLRPGFLLYNHMAGKAMMATHYPVYYCVFLLFNSIGLFISLQMMLLLSRLELPLGFELRIAVYALGAAYTACLIAITPSGILFELVQVLTFIPMTIPAVTIVLRHYKKGQCSASLPSTSVGV